jgi:hypothetical protein
LEGDRQNMTNLEVRGSRTANAQTSALKGGAYLMITVTNEEEESLTRVNLDDATERHLRRLAHTMSVLEDDDVPRREEVFGGNHVLYILDNRLFEITGSHEGHINLECGGGCGDNGGTLSTWERQFMLP